MESADRGAPVDPALLSILACPRCRGPLAPGAALLGCPAGHEYPVVDGVPVFLVPGEQTVRVALGSLAAAALGVGAPLYLDTLALSNASKAAIRKALGEHGGHADSFPVDPVISHLVGTTCGHGYAHLNGRLETYPIPRSPVDPGAGDLLLDLGCNWGRWSVAAARKGWSVVGLDPSLGAIMAARRAFKDVGKLSFVCGDARFMPFRSDVFGCVFSYSVLQHFPEPEAERALGEVGRVLRPGGVARIQMAHRGGLRSTYARSRPDYEQWGNFRVRYWSLERLASAFARQIGPTVLVPEAYGGLGLLAEDWRFVSWRAKLLILVSVAAKAAARLVRPLIRLADSVTAISTKR